MKSQEKLHESDIILIGNETCLKNDGKQEILPMPSYNSLRFSPDQLIPLDA